MHARIGSELGYRRVHRRAFAWSIGGGVALAARWAGAPVYAPEPDGRVRRVAGRTYPGFETWAAIRLGQDRGVLPGQGLAWAVGIRFDAMIPADRVVALMPLLDLELRIPMLRRFGSATRRGHEDPGGPSRCHHGVPPGHRWAELVMPTIRKRACHVVCPRATIQGVLARNDVPRVDERLATVGPWVQHGEIPFEETVTPRFDTRPVVLQGRFSGSHHGRRVVSA